jgi:hypothetical protein
MLLITLTENGISFSQMRASCACPRFNFRVAREGIRSTMRQEVLLNFQGNVFQN